GSTTLTSPSRRIAARVPLPSLGEGARERSAPPALLRLLGELRDDDIQVADDAEVAEAEDRRLFVLVDRDDQPGGAHPGLVLHRAGDAAGDVDRRLHRLAGLP